MSDTVRKANEELDALQARKQVLMNEIEAKEKELKEKSQLAAGITQTTPVQKIEVTTRRFFKPLTEKSKIVTEVFIGTGILLLGVSLVEWTPGLVIGTATFTSLIQIIFGGALAILGYSMMFNAIADWNVHQLNVASEKIEQQGSPLEGPLNA